jgi:hypothetical protein
MEEFEVMEGQECRALHILSWCLSNANIESEPGELLGCLGAEREYEDQVVEQARLQPSYTSSGDGSIIVNVWTTCT